MLDDVLNPIDCGIADASGAYSAIVTHVNLVTKSMPLDTASKAIIVALMYTRYSQEKKSEIFKINATTSYRRDSKLSVIKGAWKEICENDRLAESYQDASADLDLFVKSLKNDVMAASVNVFSQEIRSINTATTSMAAQVQTILTTAQTIDTNTKTLKKTKWEQFVSEIHWVKSVCAKPLERSMTFLILTVVSLLLLALAKLVMPSAITHLVETLDSIIAYLKK